MSFSMLNRRKLGKAGAMALLGSLLPGGALAANATSGAEGARTGGKTFVLVHGAWYGGWCWNRVAEPLRRRGHRVSTPTCPGNGELKHLLSKDITLSTWITAVENHLVYEDLKDVILVGSGFAGVVISGVADRVPHLLRSLVYLDALVLPNGSSAFDEQPAAITQKRIEQAQSVGGGIGIPQSPIASYGIHDKEMEAWVEARLGLQPIGPYQEKLVLRNPLGNGVPRIYVDCNASPYPPLEGVKKKVREQSGWRRVEFKAHHDPMITEPEMTIDFLESI